MTNHRASLPHLSDDDLITEVHRCAADERQATAQLIASLAELDARRLYLGAGCSSMFVYCTTVLHLSEHAAYHRIEATRIARKFPLVLDMLAEGAITLTTVGLLAPLLTPDNHRDVLGRVRHRSKRDVEHVVAALRPQADVSPVVRKLPAPTRREPTTSRLLEQNPAAPPVPCSDDMPVSPSKLVPPRLGHRAVLTPLAPERYKVQCTVSRPTYEKLRRAQDLLRHSIPNGDPAEILDRALTALLATLEKRKTAATERPRAGRAAKTRTRHIPAAVKRSVWSRDGGRCAFVGTHGRCRETGFLEFHHVVPYAAGGDAVVDGIQLRCRAHNQYEAKQDFGNADLPLVREAGAVFWATGTSSGPSRGPRCSIAARRSRSR